MGCGLVNAERMVSEEAEYRLFSESDSSSRSKIRVGQAVSKFSLNDISTWHSKLAPDDREFLYVGRRNIDQIMNRLFKDSQPAAVRARAKELFQQAYLLQLEQKEGKRGFTNKSTRRQKFARRKPFVVSCVWVALIENGFGSLFTVAEISRHVEGADVSSHSLKKCLRELNVDLRLFRKRGPGEEGSSLLKRKSESDTQAGAAPAASASTPVASPGAKRRKLEGGAAAPGGAPSKALPAGATVVPQADRGSDDESDGEASDGEAIDMNAKFEGKIGKIAKIEGPSIAEDS